MDINLFLRLPVTDWILIKALNFNYFQLVENPVESVDNSLKNILHKGLCDVNVTLLLR